jgi:hypothetical protein
MSTDEEIAHARLTYDEAVEAHRAACEREEKAAAEVHHATLARRTAFARLLLAEERQARGLQGEPWR